MPSSVPRGCLRFATALIPALVPLESASAQTFQGRVLGAGEEAVATALVRLEDAEGVQLGATLADSTGGYVLRAPAPGEYVLVAERLGYEPFRSHRLAVSNPEGLYPVDLVMQPAPLPIAGLAVEADRLERIERGLRHSIGISPRSLRVTPFFRPAIEEHLAKGHALSDMIRWLNVPSIVVLEPMGLSEGPCFQYRNRGCLPVYLNEQRMDGEWTDLLPLDIAETVVVVMPNESIRFPGGGVILYTSGWITN